MNLMAPAGVCVYSQFTASLATACLPYLQEINSKVYLSLTKGVKSSTVRHTRTVNNDFLDFYLLSWNNHLGKIPNNWASFHPGNCKGHQWPSNKY